MILNTKTKTITPEGETFGEIYQELQKMRPDDWMEYKMEPQVVQQWITYPVYPVYPDTTPWNPNPYLPVITWDTSSGISTSDILCMAFASSAAEIKNCCKTAN